MDDKGLRGVLMGEPSDADIVRMLRGGAVILDIRSKPEYDAGHIPDALHVPMSDLLTNLSRIPKDQQLITCNAEDALSASAAEILVAHGYRAVDGGAWSHVAALLQRAGRRS